MKAIGRSTWTMIPPRISICISSENLQTIDFINHSEKIAVSRTSGFVNAQVIKSRDRKTIYIFKDVRLTLEIFYKIIFFWTVL